jgi:hypothetical protein
MAGKVMNRFELALKIYEELNPNAVIDGEDAEMQAGYPPVQLSSPWQPGPPGLVSYIRSIQPLPSYTMLLGICEDGLPLLLDLEHYQTGPILITGSHSKSLRDFIRSIIGSARLINSPGLIDYLLITPSALAFGGVGLRAAGQAIQHPADRSAQALIMHLCALAEQRNTGRQRGATLILAIEDLDTLIRYMHQDVFAHFLWLLREGPFARIWPIATLHAGSSLFTDFKFETLFTTRILVSNTTSTGEPGTSTGGRPDLRLHQVITGDHLINVTYP